MENSWIHGVLLWKGGGLVQFVVIDSDFAKKKMYRTLKMQNQNMEALPVNDALK